MTALALDGKTYRVTLAALPDAPRRARRFLADRLRLWGSAADDAADSALLLLSEIVTNAVQATGRDSGPVEPFPCETVPAVEIRVAVSGAGLVVAVWDNSSAPPVIVDAPDDRDGEHGRGMFLVSVLADEWGWYRETLPPASVPGKTVWFRLALSLAAAPRW